MLFHCFLMFSSFINFFQVCCLKLFTIWFWQKMKNKVLLKSSVSIYTWMMNQTLCLMNSLLDMIINYKILYSFCFIKSIHAGRQLWRTKDIQRHNHLIATITGWTRTEHKKTIVNPHTKASRKCSGLADWEVSNDSLWSRITIFTGEEKKEKEILYVVFNQDLSVPFEVIYKFSVLCQVFMYFAVIMFLEIFLLN